jgi:hypothetical protein
MNDEKDLARMDTMGDSTDSRTASAVAPSSHTPGPWTVDVEAMEWHCGVRGGGVMALAVWAPPDGVGRCSPVAWVHPYLSLGDPASDARLIAAAPDLLAALTGLMDAAMMQVECTHGEEPDYCDGCAYAREKVVGLAMSKAREAIAKADGSHA